MSGFAGASGASPRRRVLWLGMAMALTVTGCAAPGRTGPAQPNAWQGRLALQVDSDPPQSYAGGFDLQGTPQEGMLALSSPLGQTLAVVSWTPQGAQLRQGERLSQHGSLNELTRELAGTALPVAAMFDWLHGQASQADGWEADLSRHAEGRVTARRSHPLPSAQLRLIFQP